MNIITPKGQVDTEKEAIILVFNNDDELSSFISKIVTTPVRTSGIRILSLIPENIQLTPLQESVLSVIEGLDGAGGDEHEKIVDDSVNGLNNILNNY